MESKPRINASMLAKHHNQMVTVMGIAKPPSDDGMSFVIQSSDNVDLTVRVPEPLQEYIEGLIEVQGRVDNRNDIECTSYVLFPKNQTSSFDMASYDKAVQLIQRFPQYYAPPASS